MLWTLLLLGLISSSEQRSLSLTDLQSLVDTIGDEIVSHEGLHAAARMPEAVEEDIPHPIKVNNWAPDLKVGQISAVAVNSNDQPVIFQRGPIEWNEGSFNPDWTLANRKVIEEDAILVLDPDTGDVISSTGKNLFYMPHGLTLDGEGNMYVTDTGLHQVMRLPVNSSKPDLVLGEAFVPGVDETHFCAPTSVAVADSADFFFVADGYCNNRILKYNKRGNLVSIITGRWNIPHSLALFENSDVLCVANREGQEVSCMRAGLDSAPHFGGKDVTGTQVTNYKNMGRVFAIAEKGTALLSISGAPSVEGVTIDTAAQDQKIIDRWADGKRDDIANPHDLAISPHGDAVYVAEIGDKSKKFKLHKYEVVNPAEENF